MRAYSMGRFQRVVGTDGRFSGTWVVLLAHGTHRASVKPHDVTVYDEARHSGRVLGPDSLIAWVDADGNVDLPEHMIRESIRYDVLDAEDELRALLPLIVSAAQEPADPSPSPQPQIESVIAKTEVELEKLRDAALAQGDQKPADPSPSSGEYRSGPLGAAIQQSTAQAGGTGTGNQTDGDER